MCLLFCLFGCCCCWCCCTWAVIFQNPKTEKNWKIARLHTLTHIHIISSDTLKSMILILETPPNFLRFFFRSLSLSLFLKLNSINMYQQHTATINAIILHFAHNCFVSHIALSFLFFFFIILSISFTPPPTYLYLYLCVALDMLLVYWFRGG